MPSRRPQGPQVHTSCHQRDWSRAQAEHTFHEVRFGGSQSSSSNPAVVNPYGRLPYQQAGGLNQGFTGPLSAYFGVQPGQGAPQRIQKQYSDQMAALGGSDSPLAQYIRQAGGYLPQVFGMAQGVGQNIASRAPGLFDVFQNQLQGSLAQLPGMNRAAQQGVGQAQQATNQAFSPIAQNSLFQNALRQSLESSRAGAGGRGLLDAGGQAGMEEASTRDLAAQFAQQQFGNQQASLQGLQGALGTQAGLAQLGPALGGMGLQALPGLQQALQAGYQDPMQALGAVFQQLAAYQNPQLALLGLTGPQVGTASRSGGTQIL